MTRMGWAVTLLAAFALLLLPGFLERWRRVRRALGAVFVFWIALNLWGTSLHLTGLAAPSSLRGIALLGPPLVLAAAWVMWDLRRSSRA
ncbi:MAG TPA: hypothetical protein VIZ31_04460 [Vicinamibacteria bacterium]